MKKGDGVDCKCAASSYHDCGCGADWTPSEVYELREKLKVAREELSKEFTCQECGNRKKLSLSAKAEKALAELGEK